MQKQSKNTVALNKTCPASASIELRVICFMYFFVFLCSSCICLVFACVGADLGYIARNSAPTPAPAPDLINTAFAVCSTTLVCIAVQRGVV